MLKKHTVGVNLVLIVILILSALVSCCIGQYEITFSQLRDASLAFMNGQQVSKEVSTVLFTIRIPRIILAIIIGSGLSLAGAAYQGIFVNPMVSPDLLGASAGAGSGAALALLIGASSVVVQSWAFVGGLVAVMITYSIAKMLSKSSADTITLVLTGMVISSLFQAVITFIKYVADPNDKLPTITYWLMGSLATTRVRDVLFICIPYLIGVLPLILMRWQINALAFGDAEARTLGVNVPVVRGVIIVCATIITSSSVAVAGMIGWVGLVIPHLSRMIVGPNYKKLMPACGLLGGIFLLWVDNLARGVLPSELPLSMLTAAIGAPFFIFLLYRTKRSQR